MPIDSSVLTLGPWYGGVNYSKPAIELQPDELFSMTNMTILNNGELRKSKGFSKLNDSALNSGATVTGVGENRFSSSSSETFAFCGNNFYSDVGGTPTSRKGSVTISTGNDKTWITTNCNGTMLAVNGNGNDPAVSWAGATSNLTTADVDSRFTSAGGVVWWDNRAWAWDCSSGEDRAFYSSNTDITSWGANDYFQIGERIYAVIPFQSFLALIAEDSIHGLFPTGNASLPYSRERRVEKGATARRSVKVSEAGWMYFAREDGIYRWDGGVQPEKISGKLEGERYWSLLNSSRISEVFTEVVDHLNQIWFFFPNGSSQTSMNNVMIWDERIEAWSGPLNGFTRDSSGYFSNGIYAGGYDGYVYKHDDTEAFSGSSLNCEARLGAPPAIAGATDVRWLYARHHYSTEDENYEIGITQSGPTIPSNLGLFNVGDPSDAIETEFIVGESSIRGTDWGSYIDTRLWGYDPLTQLMYFNSSANQPFTIRQVELMWQGIGNNFKAEKGIV